MKKLLFLLSFSITTSYVFAQANKSGLSTTPAMIEKKIQPETSDIIIRETKDFTWNASEILNQLGYKTILFRKGSYVIKKDEKHPFGTVTLAVIKSIRSETNKIAAFPIYTGGCYFRGLDCYTSGLAPCNSKDRLSTELMEIASIEPVIKKGILKEIKIIFLTNGKTNGKKLAGGPETAEKQKLFCVTVSCCGIGPFSVEIWSQKTCHYVSAERTSSSNINEYIFQFETNKQIKELVVNEDIMLAGAYNDSGQNLTLPKGIYSVKNNAISFAPAVVGKSKKYCYTVEASGSFLGHEYNYSIETCISFGASRKGVVELEPKLRKEELAELKKRGIMEFKTKEDISINDKDFRYVLKAGTYLLNSDGKIYLQNQVF